MLDPEVLVVAQREVARPGWATLRHDRRFWVAAVIVALFALMAAVPSVFVAWSPGSHDPHDCSLRAEDGRFQDRLRPSGDHWFGTDLQGCDYFARVVHGARPSLVVGVGAMTVMFILGVVLGGLAGLKRGRADSLVSRIGDVFLGFPLLLGAILLLSVLAGRSRSAAELAIVLGVLSWPFAARLFRASVIRVGRAAYVEAARSLGASETSLFRQHVVPNSMWPLVAFATVAAGAFIAIEAGLAFLGVGLQLPTVSWGRLIATAERRVEDTPHLLLFPGLFVTLVVLAFVLLGDAIHDAFEPRSRK